MKTEETIDFNEAAVKAMTKEQFIEMHDKHPANIDWAAKYDEIVGKEKPVKAEKVEKGK